MHTVPIGTMRSVQPGTSVSLMKQCPRKMISRFVCFVLITGLVCLEAIGTTKRLSAAEPVNSQILLAHYMPWYEAKPVSQRWGWHWTMNHFDPDKQADGKSEIASHFHPLIGPYDSSDRHVLEYQLLTMKLAGIDGVIVDWYGLTDFRDYAILHRNTTRMLETAERLQMKFVICYEDQTIPALVEGKRIAVTDRVRHAASEIEWLGKYWFQSPSYVRLNGKPVLLSFGQTGLTGAEWSECLKQSKVEVNYFSQQFRRDAAVGAFDWPTPSEPLQAFERFHRASGKWQMAIPVAFPRFVDIYAEAGVGKSYGRLDDDQGQSFRKMLERGMQSKAPLIQIATWNDWGEGTQIEPSHELGYRDLETILELRRKFLPVSRNKTKLPQLRLPARLLEQRRQLQDEDSKKRLDHVAGLLAEGKLHDAESMLP